MDKEVVETLSAAGYHEGMFLHLPAKCDMERRLAIIEDRIVVMFADNHVELLLKPASQLFTGERKPPSFERGPTPEYEDFFKMIEFTALNCARLMKFPPKDAEFERLYRHFARRPDGKDANPLFSHIQAAARLYMSLHDTSMFEFDEVIRRLSRSARCFSQGPASVNYYELLDKTFGVNLRGGPA